MVAEGQTIDVSGSGPSLVFLGAVNNGTASGTGTITCGDGSTQSVTRPEISHGIGDRLNGMHLFAWGLTG